MKHFKIVVKTLQDKILTYTVEKYEIQEGYITFRDERSNTIKRFHSSNTEIYEVEENV